MSEDDLTIGKSTDPAGSRVDLLPKLPEIRTVVRQADQPGSADIVAQRKVLPGHQQVLEKLPVTSAQKGCRSKEEI